MPALTPLEVRRISVAAEVDPRTVQSYLDGNRVHPAKAQAIEAALRTTGYERLVRKEGK